MPIGVLLHVLALLMLPFSSLEPLLKRLKLSKLSAALILLAGLAAALLPPVVLSPDFSIALSAPYCVALSLALMLTAKRYKLFALLAAILSGMLAFTAKLFLPPPPLEPGLLPGLFAALGALLAGRGLKTRISGALLAPIFAQCIYAAVDLSSFGYVSLVLGGGAFAGEAAISLYFTCIAALLIELKRERAERPERAFGS